MTTLFINFDVNTGLSINTFRKPNGYYSDDVSGLVEDVVADRNGCCPLDGALDAARDGSAWAGTNATTYILEMIDTVICEYELSN